MVSVADECEQAWARVMDDVAPITWVTLGYEGKNKIIVKAEGEGGRSECLKSITDDKQILFGGFRLTAIDERSNVTSKRAKFVRALPSRAPSHPPLPPKQFARRIVARPAGRLRGSADRGRWLSAAERPAH